MSKGKKKNASEQNEARALILRILVGFVAGMIVMLLMMAIFSSIIVKSDLTGAVVYIFWLLACCFATFLSGFVVTRPFHKKGLPFGILAALPLTAVACIMALAANHGSVGAHFYIMAAVMLLCGALGGIFAANLRKFK